MIFGLLHLNPQYQLEGASQGAKGKNGTSYVVPRINLFSEAGKAGNNRNLSPSIHDTLDMDPHPIYTHIPDPKNVIILVVTGILGGG